jgi:S1-C subfamily serine protease
LVDTDWSGMGLRGRQGWKLLSLLCALATACGGDPSAPELSERDATSDECAAGGTVLRLDGRDVATVCNGANGRDGVPGERGTQGERGAEGADGAPGARGPAGTSAVSTSEIVEGIAAKASAIVIVECTDGVSFGDGSGTKTDTGTVITALHVVEDMTACRVYSESPVALLGNMTDHTQRAGRDEVELTVDWTADAANIAGLAPHLGVVPSIGELVTVVGHPGLYDGLALEHQYTTGFVTATHLQGTFATVPALADWAAVWSQAWSTDAVAWHGNSGGPVFDADGNWIGILVGAFNGGADNAGPDLSVVLPLF